MSANHNLDPSSGRAHGQPDDVERDENSMPAQSQANPRPQMNIYTQVNPSQDITRPMEVVKLPTQQSQQAPQNMAQELQQNGQAPPSPAQVRGTQQGLQAQRPGTSPLDCTVQMRGRGKTREVAPRNPDAPWEKPEEPEEPEEPILSIPVSPPPPSSTNHRLPAIQRPLYADDQENQGRQTASGNFSASKDSPALRQAVRYKTGTSPSIQTPKMVDPGPSKKKRPPLDAPNAGTYSSSELKRARVNPNLLKPERSKSKSFYDSEDTAEEDDDRFDAKPDRFEKLSSSSDSQAFSWSELQHVVVFYFTEVWSMFGHPREFLADHAQGGSLAEPIAFMILSGGIAAVFLTLSGAISDAISTLFGTVAFTIISAMAAHYAGQWLGEPDCDIGRCFRILAYCQAPLLVSWVRLGAIPVGWLCAVAYSMYLTVIGLEEVFGMSRNHAIMIAAGLTFIIRGLLHLVGL